MHIKKVGNSWCGKVTTKSKFVIVYGDSLQDVSDKLFKIIGG